MSAKRAQNASSSFFSFLLMTCVHLGSCGTEVGNGWNGGRPIPNRQDPKDPEKTAPGDNQQDHLEAGKPKENSDPFETPTDQGAKSDTAPMGAPGAATRSAWTSVEIARFAQGCWPAFATLQNFAATDSEHPGHDFIGVYNDDGSALKLEFGSEQQVFLTRNAKSEMAETAMLHQQNQDTKTTWSCQTKTSQKLAEFAGNKGRFREDSVSFTLDSGESATLTLTYAESTTASSSLVEIRVDAANQKMRWQVKVDAKTP